MNIQHSVRPLIVLTSMLVGLLFAAPCQGAPPPNMAVILEEIDGIIQSLPTPGARVRLIQDLGELYAGRGETTKAFALYPLIEHTYKTVPSPFFHGIKAYDEIDFFIRIVEALHRDHLSHVRDPFIHKALGRTEKEPVPGIKRNLFRRLFEYHARRQQWGKAEALFTKAFEANEEASTDSIGIRGGEMDLRLAFAEVSLENGNVFLAKFQMQELDHAITTDITVNWTERYGPALARLQAAAGDVAGAEETIETVFAVRWQRWKDMYPDTFAEASRTVWDRKVIDLCRVVQALVKVGDTLEAERIFEKTWKIYQKEIEPNSINEAHAVSRAAATLGKWKLALTLFSPSSNWDRAETLSALFRSLLKAGLPSKAVPLVETPKDLALFVHIQKDIGIFEHDVVGKALLKIENFKIKNSQDFRPIYFAKGLTGNIEKTLTEARALSAPDSKSYALLGVADSLWKEKV